jgi:hypothetical protein
MLRADHLVPTALARRPSAEQDESENGELWAHFPVSLSMMTRGGRCAAPSFGLL